jgi:hypothetical protein
MEKSASDDTQELVHDVPFPLFLRGVILAMGLFAIVVPTWELGRGVWPLNGTTPFFAFMIAGSWFLGFVAAVTALLRPSAVMIFRRGELEVQELFIWKRRVRKFGTTEIATIGTFIVPDSEGSDHWNVQIKMNDGEVFRSRPFDADATARKCEADFRRALGM